MNSDFLARRRFIKHDCDYNRYWHTNGNSPIWFSELVSESKEADITHAYDFKND